MDGRERIRATLDGEAPDRVPRALAFYRVEAERLAPQGAWRDGLVDVRFVRFETPAADAAFFSRAAPSSEPDTRLDAEVERRVKTLGRAGLVLAPAYDIDEEDVPWTNGKAFLDGAERHGAP